MADNKSEKMDMSLDDIIKMNPQPGRGGRGGRRGRGRPFVFNRRDSNGEWRGVNRGGVQRRRDFRQPAPFIRTTEVPDVWQHDLYDDDRPPRASSRSYGAPRSAKLLITNLDYGVNDQDIRELFADFGSLKHSNVHYDRSGRSLGTADVEYVSASDAIKAMKQYNNVPLDGKPMKIKFEGDGVVSEQPRSMSSRLGRVNSQPSARGQSFGRPRSFGGRRGRGGGARGRGRGQSSSLPSKEQLDAELDAYNSKMDTE